MKKSSGGVFVLLSAAIWGISGVFSCFEPFSSIACTVVFPGTILALFDHVDMICIIVTVAMLVIQKNK